MLSLILYGRNDAHGYNLHKRAAISLNAIAEVLNDDDDEIIFVDYNTPDELPTFLETIADTLTERAKRYIRVIRVRPDFHRRYAAMTGLVALESQSRNIAIRRANPANRWILSTNTDMIFVPAVEGESLDDICGRLADGFYHLPRFELPEGFWERANRLDPVGMIEQMRVYGKRFHLNEVVYGGFDNLYEAPGDFQLFLRDDLYRIGGFDETMLKGWHVDTNTARRMKILRGKVDTAFPALLGYHCGHTRQATSLHGARRTENSLDTYVRDIKTAYWTTEDTWGAPDEAFEEMRLTTARTPLYLAALSAAVAEGGPDYSEAVYNESTYCEEGFDAAHVLPHLGDIVFNMPPNRSVFMVGTDAELITGFERFITLAPMNAQLFVCAEQDSPGEPFPAPALDLEEGLSRADVVVIQYPNARTVSPHQRADLEWYAQHALERFIEIERGRDKSERRRIVVINGMHSRLQDLIGESLDAAAIPFSARIRQGRVFDTFWHLHAQVDSTSPDRAAYEAVGRQRAYAKSELATLTKVLGSPDGQDTPGWERMAMEAMALAAYPDFVANRIGVAPDSARRVAEQARAIVVAASTRCAVPPVSVSARTDIPTRLCSSADWEDDKWLKLALRYFGERAYTMTTRSRWLWERVSLLHELRNRLSPEDRPWIVIIADGPEALAAMAAHQGYRVAYATTDAILKDQTVENWFQDFELSNIVLPGSLLPLDRAPADARFAAMLAPGACLFCREQDRPRNVVARIVSRMAPSAHFGMSSLVHINHSIGGGALSLADFRGAIDGGGVLDQLGLKADAPADASIPLDTAVRFAPEDQDSECGPGLSFGFGKDANLSIGMLWGSLPLADGQISTVKPVRSATLAKMLPIEPPMPRPKPAATPAPAPEAILVPVERAPILPVPATLPMAPPISATESEAASAFAAALKSRVLIYPAIFPSLRRNLLPSLVSHDVVERSTLRIVMKAGADGRVRFGAPLANFCPGSCVIHLAVSGADDAPRATLVGAHGVAPGKVSGGGGILTVRFQSSENLGDGMAVLDFAADMLEVSVLAVAREAAVLAPAAH